MPIPSALVTRFFQLLVERRFAEARRELNKIKEKMHKSEWNKGYFRALRGMLTERRSDSGRYAFLSELDLNDKKALKKYKKEFQAHVKSDLHEDFDRGYFSAWTKFMRVLDKLAVNNPKMKNGKSKNKNDKDQSKIETFLKEKS